MCVFGCAGVWGRTCGCMVYVDTISIWLFDTELSFEYCMGESQLPYADNWESYTQENEYKRVITMSVVSYDLFANQCVCVCFGLLVLLVS